MPDFEIIIHYPFSKAINTKGAVIRVFKAEDMTYMYVTPTPLVAVISERAGSEISGYRSPSSRVGEYTGTITPTALSRVVVETPGTGVRVS